MSNLEDDPWARWYDAYLAQRMESRAALRLAHDRRHAANVMAGLLLASMLVGGIAASVAVRLVMAN